MGAPYLVVGNPAGRTKKGRFKKGHHVARAHNKRKDAKRRHNPGVYLLGNKRKGGHKRRHNPRGLFGSHKAFTLFGVDVGAGVLAGAGIIGTGIVTGLVAGAVPLEQVKSGPGKMLLKVLVAVGLASVSGFALGKDGAKWVGVGGMASVVADAYKMAQAQVPQLPTMGDYNAMLGDYEPVVMGDYECGGQTTAGVGDLPPPNRAMWAPNWAVR